MGRRSKLFKYISLLFEQKFTFVWTWFFAHILRNLDRSLKFGDVLAGVSSTVVATIMSIVRSSSRK